MDKQTTPWVDDHLQALQGMQEAETDPFFYTRLKARMEKQEQPGWVFPLKPVWLIAPLLLLLAVNGWVLVQRSKDREATATTTATLQQFAASYNLQVSSY